MNQAEQELAPWEVPPDEAYWQALLQEGEHGEGATETNAGEDQGLIPEWEAHIAEQAMPAIPDETSPEPPDTNADCWIKFAECQQQEQTVDLQVVGSNRGGLLVRWDGVMGFVPASQLCSSPPYGNDEVRRESLADRIGQTLTLKVIEVDAAQNRLILSERAAHHAQEPSHTIMDQLNPGDICQGQITNLCAFGAFVDLGGVEGLIHISELSWGRVSHPADVVRSGQEVEVYVLNIDRAQGRVGLSLKRLQPDPWQTVDIRYQVGQEIAGTITNIVHFGAFVRLEEGLEGLIHASELANTAQDAARTVHQGEIVHVRIMSIDGARHRIGLNLL